MTSLKTRVLSVAIIVVGIVFGMGGSMEISRHTISITYDEFMASGIDHIVSRTDVVKYLNGRTEEQTLNKEQIIKERNMR